MRDALYRLQQAFEGVLDNLPNRLVAWTMRRIIFPWGHPQAEPDDRLGQAVAQLLIAPGAARDRLTASCFIPANENEPVGALEQALAAAIAAEPLEARIRAAEKSGDLEGDPRANVRDIAQAAHAAGVLDEDDYRLIERRNRLRDRVIGVDDFPFDYGITGALRPAARRQAA
ncbi:acyl-CoA dehydrogenase [Bordetella pertussis]|nr:acyl-CoA dehydrogenase [Bordetella pertussis]